LGLLNLVLLWYACGLSGKKGSSSSNGSKFSLEVGELTGGVYGEGWDHIVSQSNPSKKAWSLISFTPFLPNLFSASQISFLIRSVAATESYASGGITNVFFQWSIFWHVIDESSLKNGGYPTSISKRITPTDHQSTVSSYPFGPKTSGAI